MKCFASNLSNSLCFLSCSCNKFSNSALLSRLCSLETFSLEDSEAAESSDTFSAEEVEEVDSFSELAQKDLVKEEVVGRTAAQ